MKESNRIGSLDSVRGIAALLVVIYHSLMSFNTFYGIVQPDYNPNDLSLFMKIITYAPVHIFWAGRESVLLFFVLSGFVLSLPFLAGRYHSYKAFAIKRFCRIYIPYIFVMFLSAFLLTLFSDYKNIPSLTDGFNSRWSHPVTWKAILSYIFMIDNEIDNVNGATWSLIHEMRISFMFPFIMMLLRYNWKKSLFYGLGVTFGLWLVLTVASKVESLGHAFMYVTNALGDTFFYSAFFVAGAILAKYSSHIASVFKNMKPTYKALLFFVGILLYNSYLLDLLPIWPGLLMVTLKIVIARGIVLISVVILLIVILNSDRLTRFLNHPSLLWLGKVSYSIYLIHLLVIICAGKYLGTMMPMPVAFILVPVITLMLAGLMYKYVEYPAIQLGYKLSSRRNLIEEVRVIKA